MFDFWIITKFVKPYSENFVAKKSRSNVFSFLFKSLPVNTLLLPANAHLKTLLKTLPNCRFIIFCPYFIWERKIFKSNGFFYKICHAPSLYSTLRVLPKEFNSHKLSFVRFVFVEISGFF